MASRAIYCMGVMRATVILSDTADGTGENPGACRVSVLVYDDFTGDRTGGGTRRKPGG